VSQKTVEAFVGRLATDEEFRDRFKANRGAVLDELVASGTPLTSVERRALLGLNFESCERFAGMLDPRLQKVCTRKVSPGDASFGK
jgi:hypothetical protein